VAPHASKPPANRITAQSSATILKDAPRFMIPRTNASVREHIREPLSAKLETAANQSGNAPGASKVKTPGPCGLPKAQEFGPSAPKWGNLPTLRGVWRRLYGRNCQS